MKAVLALVAMAILMGIVYVGVDIAGLEFVFGVAVPYAAMAIFLVGFSARIIGWARSPVPFNISTSAGQSKSLPWIKNQPLESPSSTLGVIGRMALEVLFFRSLFRNTRAKLDKDQPRLGYISDKALWAAGLLFHWCFFIIFVRHLRFFIEPTPGFIRSLESLDGFFQLAVPALFLTDIGIVVGLTYLVGRRLLDGNLRYISLPADYFALFLLLAVALTGISMRYVTRVDITAAKSMAMGLVTFSPVVPEGIGLPFYMHVFMISVLFAYFPFSKLVHMGGVFMSPSRNLRSDSRAVRHVNPWNPGYDVIKPHTYDEWEDEYRDKLKAAGLPLERE